MPTSDWTPTIYDVSGRQNYLPLPNTCNPSMSTSKKPDPRYEDRIWSISSSGSLYYGTMPGQARDRHTRIGVPTKLGKVLEVKHTKKWVTRTGGSVSAFKFKVSPVSVQPPGDTSPVYAVNKWWVLAEGLFDPFEHVEHWQTPQSILDDYDIWTQTPNDTKVAQGKWLKSFFKGDQLEDSGYNQRGRKRAQVRTITPGADGVRRQLDSTSSSSSSSSSKFVDVFGTPRPASQPAPTATDARMLSQDSNVQPPQRRTGIVMCVCCVCSV